MSILGTPKGMTFSEWVINSGGDSVLAINDRTYGPKSDWLSEKYSESLKKQLEEVQAELDEEPPWTLYVMMFLGVFLVGTVLGR